MYKLCVGSREWLFDGTLVGQSVKTGKPVKLTEMQRARRAAKILMARDNVKRAEIVPYAIIGESLVIRK